MSVVDEVTPIDSINQDLPAPCGAIHLDSEARALAARLKVVTDGPNLERRYQRQLDSEVSTIEDTHRKSVQWLESHDNSPPVADWLLDNYYIIQEQIAEVRRHLPAGFFRELPKLSDGRPRVHLVARELVQLCDCALDEEILLRFVDQFQSNATLTIGECWAFPIMLRLTLIARLADICQLLQHDFATETNAQQEFDSWKSEHRFSFTESSLRSAGTIIALSKLLDEYTTEYPDGPSDLDDALRGFGWDLQDLQRLENRRAAANQLTIANIITSMRLLAGMDWVTFFESTNICERILRQDPSKVYASMDFGSRNRYRDALELLAKGSTFSELQIAKLALSKCNSVNSVSAPLVPRSVTEHVGYWLVDAGRQEVEREIHYRPKALAALGVWLKQHNLIVYFGGLAIITVVVCLLAAIVSVLLGGSIGQAAILAGLLAIPCSEFAVQFLNALISRLVPVRLLAKIEFRDGTSPQYSTMVVVPCMLSSQKEVSSLIAKLENHYLANAEADVRFALLTDFTDADTETTAQDDALVQSAIDGVRRLNAKYTASGSKPFYLFHRKRLWNASESKWMGWERKRGKLMEFGRLIADPSAPTSYVAQEGDPAWLKRLRDPKNTPFVITLDADTILPRDTARKLIGTLAHPLNRAIQYGGRVVRGYTIVQPRISIHLGEQRRTRYFQTHAISPGLDPYVSAASDTYQDLFEEGSFTGKGIYDLRSFEQQLAGRFPENTVLSHDLIEGAFTRVAFASDIEFFDGYPLRLDADAKRQHRWVRGDWQISKWLLPRVPTDSGSADNQLSILSRWKILDNLRRSMVAPLLCIFLLATWWLESLPTYWTVIGSFVLLAPVLLHLCLIPLGLRGSEAKLLQLWDGLARVSRFLEQQLYTAVWLPTKAWQMLDAISRTVFRMLFSQKHLLEWETAASVESRLGKQKWSIARALAGSSLLGLICLATLRGESLLAALPWIAAWIAAPAIGEWICRPSREVHTAPAADDLAWLGSVASATWSYFEQFVNAESNWLPPDNVQEYPSLKIAYRISPTNEGLFLVSSLVAQNSGLIGLRGLIDLWEKNLTSWQSLEQSRGHHYNWYEIRSLQTLSPRYISTVDSGNLMASYLTSIGGFEHLIRQPIVGTHRLQGLVDSLQWLKEACRSCQVSREAADSQVDGLPKTLLDGIALCDKLIAQVQVPLSTWPEVAHFLTEVDQCRCGLTQWMSVQPQDDIQLCLPTLFRQWQLVVDRFSSMISDAEAFLPWCVQRSACKDLNSREAKKIPAAIDVDVRISLLDLANQIASQDASERMIHGESNGKSLNELEQASLSAGACLERIRSFQKQLEVMAMEMDFQFLYNDRRKLFSIGYNCETASLDRGHYDLLASECRLASYLAIAKGDVEAEHWFHLGRKSTELSEGYTLLSWGGTMFEFLMPNIFQNSYRDSLLDNCARVAIRRQMVYGEQKKIPWGISESAFSALWRNTDYQYKSFGVPGLGLKRGLSKDLVVSPYSTFLALPFIPHESIQNLRELKKYGWGSWGFYDAVDFTPSRLRRNQTFVPVRNYMAHHHGMSLLSLANAQHNLLIRNWFHANPIVRANTLLLQERLPTVYSLDGENAEESQEQSQPKSRSEMVSRQINNIHTGSPRTMLFSNGQMSSMLTHTGGGFLSYENTRITRWRRDPTCDSWGSFIYLRNLSNRQFWSATYQPTLTEPDEYSAIFSVDKAEIRRRQGLIETTLEVVLSPEHAAEVRQLRIVNLSEEPMRIEVTSYAEVVLGSQASDVAHPAFQKLFIETEYFADDHSLIARRRPRSPKEKPLYAVHTLAAPTQAHSSVQFETSREQFIGRGRSCQHPAGLDLDELGANSGAVLDPVFSLRCVVEVPAGEQVSVAFTTMFARDREEALHLADLFHDFRGVQRAFELAWALAQTELRQQNMDAQQIHLYQQLGGILLYPLAHLRGSHELARRNVQSQKHLWRYGISGDDPILLLRITDDNQIEYVSEFLRANRYLLERGLKFDLVLLNEFPSSYFDSLQDQLAALVNSSGGVVHLLRSAQLAMEDLALLELSSAAVIHLKNGSLQSQLERAYQQQRIGVVPGVGVQYLKSTVSNNPSRSTEANELAQGSDLEFFNGWGGFGEHGRIYEIRHRLDSPTPAPWSNVVANPRFGALITERGGGYSWFENSRENKLTSWSNDPTSDNPSEIIYIYDQSSNAVWSATAAIAFQGERVVQHGAGFTKISCTNEEISMTTTIAVDAKLPIKIYRCQMLNTRSSAVQLETTFFAETVLGVHRWQTDLFQLSWYEAKHQALVIGNSYHPDFGKQRVFCKCLGSTSVEWTADRGEFLGRNGYWKRPAAIGSPLTGRSGSGLDPCMALRTNVKLQPNESTEIVFVLGAASDEAELERLLGQVSDPAFSKSAIEDCSDAWDKILNCLTVKTPNRSLDIIVNRWLAYQTLSCRIWGRSAFYQSGGAYGFRDQLQDAMALLLACPAEARAQILRAAARQYIEGDVQHWWHPPCGSGTRTLFSDDFLFLPWATERYISVTEDWTILDEQIQLLESPALREDEHERYECPATSGTSVSILEHCWLAMRHGMRYGPHELPLMGCGDWNDGMSNVGIEGRGESVWVGWFQIYIFQKWSKLLDSRGDQERAAELSQRAQSLLTAIETSAWDGDWYRRAFYDDGTLMGSSKNDECKIDSLAQSWSVIAGGDGERARTAWNAAITHLYDAEHQIMKLFWPAFDQSHQEPGYIKGYVPGIRENGGQYTHGGVWMIESAARLREPEWAMRLFDALNPISHGCSVEAINRYRVEPYVIAADVYTNAKHVGRGGWTWYTGSAGWMYQVAVEWLLGIRVNGNRLHITPCLPADWSSYDFTLRRGETTWNFHVVLDPAQNQHLPSECILVDDGNVHDVDLGSPS